MHKRILFAALTAAAAVVCPARAIVPTTANSVTYVGNGATTVFPTTFPFLQSSDLVITVAGSTKSLGPDYTVTGAGNATGTITFTTAPANLASVVITRTVDYKNLVNLKQQRTYDPASLQTVVDKLAMGQQQLAAQLAAPVLPSALTNATPLTATGSTTARPLQDWMADVANIKAFGGVADGATDNGPALQRAHDQFSGNGGTIYLPPSGTYYNIVTTVVFTKPIRLIGVNWAGSTIASGTASLTWFTTTNQIVAENIGFTAFGAAVNTAVFVKQLAGSSGHNGTTFRNTYLQGANKAYWAQRATEFHFESNKCNNGAYCLYLENLTSSDEGDSFVSNNEFANSTSALFVASTAGLYIENNKFNGTSVCPIDMAPNGGGGGSNNIGDFTIVGNSIEGYTICGIRLAGSFVNTKTLITGNQLSSTGSSTCVVVGNNAQNVTLTGNTCNSDSPSNGVGFDFQAGAKNITVTGNAFHQILTAMQAPTTVLGIDASGNRFAADVTNYWSGEDSIGGQTAFGGSKTFAASRSVSNASDVTYVDVFKVKGDCVVDIEISGTVQGVGNSYKFRKILVTNGSTITDAIALITVGSAFDLQVAAAGGYAVISIKRTTATGTSVTMMVTARVSGYPTGFLRI